MLNPREGAGIPLRECGASCHLRAAVPRSPWVWAARQRVPPLGAKTAACSLGGASWLPIDGSASVELRERSGVPGLLQSVLGTVTSNNGDPLSAS